MAKGRQINLDEGEGQIGQAFLTDDFFACSSFLEIVFECDKKCSFGPDVGYYFTYQGIDWIPYSFSESTGANMNWHYEMSCCPKCLYMVINEPITSTQKLARSLRLNLTNESSDLEIPCPIINQFAGNFIQDSRFYSFEKNMVRKRLDDAVYIYAGTDKLLSIKWHNLLHQTATTMKFEEQSIPGGDKIVFQNDSVENCFCLTHQPVAWNQRDYLAKFMGPKFTIHTAAAAEFLRVYTMKFEEIPEFDTGLPYLCIYSRKNLLEANAFVHCFANIDFEV